MVPIFTHSFIHHYLSACCTQAMRSKTTGNLCPHSPTVSLLGCTKSRVSANGTEFQILLNPQRAPDRTVQNNSCLVPNTDAGRQCWFCRSSQGQKTGTLANAERSHVLSSCLTHSLTSRSERNLENELNPFFCLWERLHLYSSLTERFSQGNSL